MFEMKESERRGLGCGDMYIGGSGAWGSEIRDTGIS